MKQISRLSLFGSLFWGVFLMSLTLISMTSCSTIEPSKKTESIEDKSGNFVKNKSSKDIEQRVDELYIRLQKIEQMIGLSEPNKNQNIEEEYLDEELIEPDESSSSGLSNYNREANTLSYSNSPSDESSLSSPEAQYKKARELLLGKNFSAAEKSFSEVALKYPNHQLAVNSLYWMGECRYSVKDYQGAISIFKQLVDKYPDGRKVPDALLKTAYSYLSINDNDNALEYLKTVVRKFPFSPAGEKAEKKLQSLR